MLEREWNYYSAVLVTKKIFMEKFVCPHEEAAPTSRKTMLPLVGKCLLISELHDQ